MNKQLGKIISTAAFTAVLAVLISATQAVATEYYKWTDKDGVVHFSEIPPTDQKAQKLKAQIRPPIVEDVPDDQASSASNSEPGDGSQQETPGRGVSYKDEARCKAERERLKALQSNERIRLKQPDGTSAYLDKAGIKREINNTREVMSKVCE